MISPLRWGYVLFSLMSPGDAQFAAARSPLPSIAAVVGLENGQAACEACEAL